MTDYECNICGKNFESAKNKNQHQATCGITQLSQYGIDIDSIGKVERHDFSDSTASSKQLQLDEPVVAYCPVCDEPLRKTDKYRGLEDYLECPKCEKVIQVD